MLSKIISKMYAFFVALALVFSLCAQGMEKEIVNWNQQFSENTKKNYTKALKERLFSQYDASVDILDQYGNTVFHILAQYVAHDINQNAQKNKYNYKPLINCAKLMINIEKKRRSKDEKIILILLTARKRRGTIFSQVPKRILVDMIRRFVDNKSSLTKILLEARDSNNQTAYEIFSQKALSIKDPKEKNLLLRAAQIFAPSADRKVLYYQLKNLLPSSVSQKIVQETQEKLEVFGKKHLRDSIEVEYCSGSDMKKDNLWQVFENINNDLKIPNLLKSGGSELRILVDSQDETIFHKCAHQVRMDMQHAETLIKTQTDCVDFFRNSYAPKIRIPKKSLIIRLLTVLDDINKKGPLVHILGMQNKEGKTAFDLLLDNAKCYTTDDNACFLNSTIVKHVIACKKETLQSLFEKFNPEYWKKLN